MFMVNSELTEQFDSNWWQLFFEFVAVITILVLSLFVVNHVFLFIYNHIISSGFKWKGGPNIWAVVTGGTDGIGLA